MKKLYFTLLFLFLSLIALSQTSPTGSSTEVGLTEGQLSVSLSGAANYTIPISVPSGINNVTPKINLVYNSQSDNGPAGYGWNISGLSSIKRIPSTKFHDGVSDPVDFDILDRFSLDGQRLIVKNGIASQYGGNETIYETENFSNIKITSYGTHSSGANYGPSYFRVEYPDGSKAYYGNSSDSRSITDWAITYWENAQGVRITYSYELANNILNIASIKYGTRLDNAPFNEIQFIYKPRSREEQTYIGGQLLIRNTILSDIRVLGNNIGFRNYNFAYESTSLLYERLLMITEKSGDNSKNYNPTVFEYENTVDDITLLPSSTSLSINPNPILPAENIITIGSEDSNGMKLLGDFGFDNKFGLIAFSSQPEKRNHYIFYPNIDSNTATAIGTKIYTGGIYDDIFLVNTLSGSTSTGYKLKQNQNWCVARTNYDNDVTTLSVFSNNSVGNNPAKFEHSINYTFPRYVETIGGVDRAYAAIKTYLSGDFNGDNITDAILIECGIYDPYISRYRPFRSPLAMDIRITPGNDTSGGKVYFMNLDPRVGSNPVNFAGNLLGEFRKNVSSTAQSSFFAGDVNADGKTDIVVRTRNVIDIYSLNENNIFVKIQTNTIAVDSNGYSQYLWFAPADYNGDGKIDYGPGLFSDGNSFITTNNLNSTYFGAFAGKLIDFNNDGKTDSFSMTPDISTLKFSSVSNTFPLTYNRVNYSLIVNNNVPNGCSILSNKNTMSKNQLALFDYPAKALKYLTINKDFSKEKLLKSVTLGNGVKEIITYSSLVNGNGVYTANILTENYPNQDIVNAPELKVVSKIEKQSKSEYKKQLFLYSGAVSNLEGLGFLGFYSTLRTNWHDDSSQIISYVSKNDISQRGINVENYEILGLYEPLRCSSSSTPRSIVKEGYIADGAESLIATQSIVLKPDTWIKSGSLFNAKINEEANAAVNTPTNFIKKTFLNYDSNLLANRVFKLKNLSNKQFDALQNISSETRTEYDTYNNPTKSTVLLKEGSSTVQTTVSNITYNPVTNSPYIVGIPSSNKKSISVNGDTTDTEELYIYSNSNLLTQIKKKALNTEYIIEENVYDFYGNIIKKTLSADGMTPRESSYIYDSSGRFLIKSTDVQGVSTDFTYNTDGTLRTQTNSYGQTTTYLYDAWFKKTKDTDYLGNSKVYLYSNSSEKTIVSISGSDNSSSEETFDDLGRKIKVGTKNIMGTFCYTSYLYDIQDRNYKISEPYFGSAPTQWSETKYDSYGRVIQNIAFTGKIINTAYPGSALTININDGTKAKIVTKNAMGNIISITDSPGGTINYTYFANGNLRESDYSGVKTTITQDGWGRKTKLVDDSAGEYGYKYNAYGETIEEITPNGITKYILDALGRLTQKTIDGVKTKSRTNYNYDSNSKLLLSSTFEDLFEQTNIISNSYTYDENKRIIKTIETTPYATFIKDLTYNNSGRLEKETFTVSSGGKTSIKAAKNTYKNGFHWQIIDDISQQILWQTNGINERGQVVAASLGNGIYINNSYDQYGYASQFKLDRFIVNPGNVMTLATLFEPQRGNLTNRTNNLFNWNENFGYDNLDRLITYNNIQGQQETQSYDEKGKILQNGIGTYGYPESGKIYQNNSITLSPQALSYYQNRGAGVNIAPKLQLDIIYNTFKSPVIIKEKGRDNNYIDFFNFNYNDGNNRSTMFYGGTQEDKLLRPLRKHYSSDGTMEIKENKTTGTIEFVTFIGGDGYSAPIVVKNNGTSDNYLYLHRDYQGNIVLVTDNNGAIVEKRLFDAWGVILKVQNGLGTDLGVLDVLDRGYTGHEHLQSVDIINMNGRIYDSKLHRFLQPDNNVQDLFNTQNYNRYGYVLNNPLKYVDKSGEFWGIVAGFLFSTYVHGGAASGGEANPFKWDSSTWLSALSSSASSIGSFNATNGVNSYVDNYSNKPTLGASAISNGNQYDITMDVFNFFPKMSNNFENGVNDRVNHVYNFFSNEARSSQYWANTLDSFGNDVMNGRSLYFNASDEYKAEIFNNITNKSIYDWAYTAGYSAPDIAVSLAIPYLAEGIATRVSTVGASLEGRVFTLNEGYGLFGKSGKMIGNYKIEALYMDSNGGGTIFSIKQGKAGGNFVRWDYGLSHYGTEEKVFHSHFRLNAYGRTYGSTAQYRWDDPSRFWNYKK